MTYIARLLHPGRCVPPSPAPLWKLWFLLPVAAALCLELCLHLYDLHVPIPDRELDSPFSTSCQEPDTSAPRENAVLVMLARNSELEQAKTTVRNIERAFNSWYHYPIVFLNDEPWDVNFVQQLNETSSGVASFEVVPQEQWTFPDWIDPESARRSIKEQGEKGIPHGGSEGYHHMCRFFSGTFYQLEALKDYKWYWRLEPNVDFSCSITYDPFVQMARNNKVYGFANALWEVGTTCPSLFRNMADWMEVQAIRPSSLWDAMVEASWMPSPFRRLMSLLPHRDRHGDAWSLCHYWSNFEIADMDFFRGEQYQALFEYLDKKGGFYSERWGDAAVHSLAVAMLLDPEQVHHFSDIGYQHGRFYNCPANAAGGQLPDSDLLGEVSPSEGNPETEGGIGCRCSCDRRPHGAVNYSSYCMRLTQPNTRDRSWLARALLDRSMRLERMITFGVLGFCAVLAEVVVSTTSRKSPGLGSGVTVGAHMHARTQAGLAQGPPDQQLHPTTAVEVSNVHKHLVNAFEPRRDSDTAPAVDDTHQTRLAVLYLGVSGTVQLDLQFALSLRSLVDEAARSYSPQDAIHQGLFHHTPASRTFESPGPSFLGPVPPVSWMLTADQNTRDELEAIISAAFEMASKTPIWRREQAFREASYQVPYEIARLNPDAKQFRVEDMGPLSHLKKLWKEMRETGFHMTAPFDVEREARIFLYFPDDAPRATAAFLAINSGLRAFGERKAHGEASDTHPDDRRMFAIAHAIWMHQTINWRRHHPDVLERIETGQLPVIMNFREAASGLLWDTNAEWFLHQELDTQLMDLTKITR